MPSAWRCGCGAYNPGKAKVCENCGDDRSGPTAPPKRPAAYREPEPKVYVRSDPSDPCPEPGCGKRVGDHIEEAKRMGVMTYVGKDMSAVPRGKGIAKAGSI